MEDTDNSGPDFNYLLSMPMWNLTQEKKDTIIKNRDERQQELRKLKATSKEEMWKKDLDEFLIKLDEVEAKEVADQNEAAASSKLKKVKGKGGKGAKIEFQPSAHAIRVDPVIADDLKAKASKAVAAKERKDKGEVKKKVKKEEEMDEFDLMAADKGLDISLSKKLGTTPTVMLESVYNVSILLLSSRKRKAALRREKRRRTRGKTLMPPTCLAVTSLTPWTQPRSHQGRGPEGREPRPQRPSLSL